MSDSASPDLCKKLYKLSGWGYEWWHDQRGGVDIRQSDNPYQTCPAYTLGYLLRKLPHYSAITKLGADWAAVFDKSLIQTAISKDFTQEHHADTPEDAAAKLAIELIKQGILKGEK